MLKYLPHHTIEYILIAVIGGFAAYTFATSATEAIETPLSKIGAVLTNGVER